VLALAVTILSMFFWRATRPVEHPLARLSVDLGPDAVTGISSSFAISPDGQRLVYPVHAPDGTQQLATRSLDQAQATLLPGTVGGEDPFFKPDGQWLGFFADSRLKTISIHGGAPAALCDAASPRGGSWGEDGNIVAALNSLSPLVRVPDGGGSPRPLTKLASGEITHRWPQVLPGARVVVFTASASSIALDDADIEATELKTGVTKILHHRGYYGRYLPSGHLVYVYQGVLFAVAFDVDRLETRGAPVPLLEDVSGFSGTGGGQLDFSRTGTLVYLPGKGAAAAWPIMWLDSFGKTQPLLATPGAYFFPRASPDGQRIAFGATAKGQDVFVYDWQRDATTRLTFDGRSSLPIWTPDGKHIAYRSNSGGFSLWWRRGDGGGEPQRLLQSQYNVVPGSFSPDGRRLAYQEVNPETGFDLWTLPLDISDPDHPKPVKPELFLRTPADERAAGFSPDGHWVVYRSNESGTEEVYVRPVSGAGGKWQISIGGGGPAFWSKNGHELFYEGSDQRIRVVDYRVDGGSFLPGKPRVWCDRQIFDPGVSHLDLAPDGKRFVILVPPDSAGKEKGSVHVTFLLNFFDELRRRIPSDK
jgi:serine/threonine-protein kinase